MELKQASLKWNISERRIRKLIKDGRIPGAAKIGNTWIMPDDTIKPIDKRFKQESEYIIDIPSDYFEVIDLKLKMLKNREPISKSVLKSLNDENTLQWTYNSNALKGSSLTLKETKTILDGIAVGKKMVKEHLEVINHRDAIDAIRKLVITNANVSEPNIKILNSILLRAIYDVQSGVYRIDNIEQPSVDYMDISEEMEKLMINYSNWEIYHPLVRAALLLGEFSKISPFIEANERTAILLMNFEAMKKEYLPIIIKANMKDRYNELLNQAMKTKDYTELVKLIAELEEEMLDKYLKEVE